MSRHVYFDEAGISSIEQEPYTVVAGAIINPDTQWREIETYYRDLSKTWSLNEELKGDCIFEAKKIWNGTSPFDREKWTFNERKTLLKQLAIAPKLFNVPIVACVVDRKKLQESLLSVAPETSNKAIRFQTYAYCFLKAVMSVDYWMKRHTSNELAFLIAEDTHEVKNGIRQLHEGYTLCESDEETAFVSDYIVDGIFFAKKNESIMLQIADHCAYIIKKTAMRNENFYPFFDEIDRQLCMDTEGKDHFILNFDMTDIQPLTPI